MHRSGCILYGFVLLVALLPFAKSCPKVCICKWKNGKQTVECNNRELIEIPDGMDPTTQVLEFSDNNLQALTKETFLKMNLVNLQKIYMARSKLSNVDERAFMGLSNLVELDLSGNLLASIPTPIFMDCPLLMKLSLGLNPITIVKNSAFAHLESLNTLELSQCEIAHLDDGAFIGLNSLEWLHLDSNKLTTIKGGHIFPRALKGVELQNNPWQCDCHILEFQEWLLGFHAPLIVDPICNAPARLHGRIIKSVPDSELACLPVAAPTSFYIEIEEGRNISLICHVHAVPEAKVVWLFEGRVLQNDTMVYPGVHLTYYIEEGKEEKRSELYVYNVNSDDNGTFVCSAQNAAGISQANYTIKIIVREEPIVIIVSFPFEYLLAAITGVSILLLFITIMVIVSIARCRRSRRRHEKHQKTKEVALQQSSLKPIEDSAISVSTKSAVPITAQQQQELICSPCHSGASRTMSPSAALSQMRNPASPRHYQPEQNPDLINDTAESRRYDGDGEDGSLCQYSEIVRGSFAASQPFTVVRRDIKLNPTGFLDTEGYPADYGLPRMHGSSAPNSFYRTLPYKGSKRMSVQSRLPSREAELVDQAAFEHYCPGVRYTADGYPAYLPSLPTTSQSGGAPSSLPYCPVVQWPHCFPANLHLIDSRQKCGVLKAAPAGGGNVSKRCVSAQTDESDNAVEEKSELAAEVRQDVVNDVLTESPDEGYEGELALV